MPLSTFAFTPTQGYRDSSFAPTDPPSEAALRDTMQDIPDQLRDALNGVINTLNSTADGSSGADNIGMTPIAGLVATTPQEALEELALKSPINVADNSITNLKLAPDVKVGSLASLLTTIKTSVVGAINELFNNKLDKTGKAADSELLDGIDSAGYTKYNATTTTINTGFSSGWSGTIAALKNHNNLVELTLNLTSTTDISFANVYTLAVGLRPIRSSNGALFGLDAAGQLVPGSLLDISVNTDGTILIFNVTPSIPGAKIVLNYKIMYYAA